MALDTNQPGSLDDVQTTSVAGRAELTGFASLPADTFAEGPPTGAGISANGRSGPFASPPIQGFSGVQFAPGGDGSTYWFLSDNGFGSKANSPDYLLRLYQVDPSFAGSEGGNGTVEIQGFVQLSDPDNLIPFDIQQEGTPERLLTGSDFDIESFVIDDNGDIWIGEEFGPYILHFDATGKLLEAPIPTPNSAELNTLNGQKPLVIAHRGASGEFPEHTLAAYRAAIAAGAEFVEPDLVITRDGVLIARHEPTLAQVELDEAGNIALDANGHPIVKQDTTLTTNVADLPQFADRLTVKNLDGVLVGGWFAEDFTFAELEESVRARQPRDYRPQAFNDLFKIPSLQQVIELVQQVEAETGVKVGIYPETKHPTFFDQQGLSLEEPLIATLQATGFTDPNRIFIQSFEFQNLIELQGLLDEAGLGHLPLVQLYGNTLPDAPVDDVFSFPYDIRFNVEQGNDLEAIYGRAFLHGVENPLSATTVYSDLDSPEFLQVISDLYAEGAGPWKNNILLRESLETPVDGDGDGVAEITSQLTGEITPFIEDAHAAGLQVHPYTLRDEERFLTLNADGTPQSPEDEIEQLVELGVDGFFTDFPGTADPVVDKLTADLVRAPQNPDFLFNTLNGQTPLVIAHRGASGDFPEHTIEAYRLAIYQGADFVEPDLAITSDGVLIARHEPMLDDTTNVAEVFGPERMGTKMLDGEEVTAYFAEDFTLAEIKQLRAIQPRANRPQEFNSEFEIPTLQEIIEMVQEVSAEVGRPIGIYPETKHPTFFDQQGLSLEEPLVQTLVDTGFTDPSRIFIQSFEVANLIDLKTNLLPAAGLEDLPLVQLFGDTEDAFINPEGGGFSVPYDFVANAGKSEAELREIYGDLVDVVDFTTAPTYADLANQDAIDAIGAYAVGLGPWKNSILLRESLDTPVDGDGDGVAEITTRLTGEIVPLIDYAHNAGLQVHPYTLRDEERFLTLNPDGTPQTTGDEFRQLIDIGADGFFTDFPETGRIVVEQFETAAEFANLSTSRGYEGMAFSPDRATLYPMLEGTVFGDPDGSLRIYEFDVATSRFEGLAGLYQMDAPNHAIGDFTPINDDEFLVIERDGNQGTEAAFKKVFKVNLGQIDDQGFVSKAEVVDLLNIADPNDLNGDGETTFSFPFVTIENLLVLDEDTILVANDNNYPFSIGRGPDIDNNEIIEIKLAEPLDLDPRLGAAPEGDQSTMSNNHVIFIHPDGTSPSHYALARFVQEGPDGRLNWDNLDHAGVYLGHMEDQLGGTSNAGAVTHATGAKVYAESFGFEQDGSEITPLSGNTGKTIVEEAIDAGKVTALVQSGAIFEPGTAAFVAETGEIEVEGRTIVPRSQLADIAKQVIESGVDFILAGGEVTLLPVGTDGFHGTAEEYDAIASDPIRRPSENLIELAETLGYTVVYTRDQLYALLEQPELPQKVLGVFAPVHTFNDRPEEVLAERGLPLYLETAPTIAEMLEVTQQLMEAHPNFENGSIAIVEEEGTDNFGNNNNAAGVLEGTLRADAVIGVAQDFLSRYENTLIITAADSDAGGLQVRDPLDAGEPVGTINNNPTLEDRPVPLDGVTGANTLPFTAAPDANGDVFPFGVAWVGTPDFPGAIVSKAEGLNADKLPATVDNTGIYELMYETLFDTELEPRVPDPTPAPEATAATGNVIFIHPDGTTPTHFMALRNIDQGPDGRTHWDMMTEAGVYLGHMEDRITGTSNGGAVTHANGVKVFAESFGLDSNNQPITPASGNVGQTIMEEAIAAGKKTALIQSGDIGEPGTAAFVAATTNRDGDDLRARDKAAEIAEQVIRSGVDVIMAGGEVYLLPKGTTGFHVTAEIDAEFDAPEDRPEINLIELAESLGYTVVYTEEQMNAAVNSDTPPAKLLGVFAADDIFDDQTEEELGLNTANPSPLYVETAPTIGEMLAASLKMIGDAPEGFFVVLEEEGTDNFGNNNNAPGTIEAVRRADEAIGVAMDYVDNVDPNTLVVTAADSDGGGLQVFQFAPYNRPSGNAISDPALLDEETEVPFIYANPTTEPGTPVFLDGQTGSTASAEFPWQSFPSMDSIDGPMGNFGIAWTGTPDVPGSIVSKAYGMNADLLPSTLDNTFIYEIMYRTLFGDDALEPTDPIDPSDPTTLTPVFGSLDRETIDITGSDQLVFAGAGDDLLIAVGSTGGNTIFAGSGNDTVVLGAGDTVFGDAGDDRFFAQVGGNNTLTGGAGADQFWIAAGELPTDPNTVVDFTAGEDVLGIAGIGASFASLELAQLEGDTTLGFNGTTLATLTGIEASSLSAANFAFV